MDTEEKRREAQELVNTGHIQPEGQTWTTEQLREDFEVEGFAAPVVLVRRRSDGVRGSMVFRHAPRVYWGFEAR